MKLYDTVHPATVKMLLSLIIINMGHCTEKYKYSVSQKNICINFKEIYNKNNSTHINNNKRNSDSKSGFTVNSTDPIS